MFDVAIIGAGPAGSTLARLIGNSCRVLLTDRRPFSRVSGPSREGKCCGGLLAPDAQRMLSEFGLGIPKAVLEGPQLFVVRAIDNQQGLERFYQRHYINMDRQAFDSWLLSMVPPNVEIRTGCSFKSYSPADGLFRIELRQGGRAYQEKAKVLVGADGASSAVRRQMAPGVPSPVKYFAIQEWVEGCGSLPYFTSVFDREISDYYSWTIPKKDSLIIGAALQPRADTLEKFERLKEVLSGIGFQFGKTICREGAFILRPMKTDHVFTGQGGIALIGEAAGWISPSSAEGISYAFKSARALAESLHVSPENFQEGYRRKTRDLRLNIFLKVLKSHFIFNPVLRRVVMNSGFRSVRPYLPLL